MMVSLLLAAKIFVEKSTCLKILYQSMYIMSHISKTQREHEMTNLVSTPG